MPTYTTTSKHALRWLTGTNVISDLDTGFQALAEDVDGKLTPYGAGLLSARPVSTPGSPGKSGRIYKATDTGQYFVDHGTGWDELRRGERTPFAHALLSSAFSVGHAVASILPLSSEVYDEPSGGQHSTVLNQDRLVCVKAGLYLIVGSAQWNPDINGTRKLTVQASFAGAAFTNVAMKEEAANFATYVVEQQVVTPELLAVGDMVRMSAFQTSGSTLTVNTAFLKWAWLSP